MDLAEQLRASILAGKYPPGTLLSQTGLAHEYSVSRIPVRDALQSLAASKLVEVIPGKGARVISLTLTELQEVFDLRIMLECDLLQRAMASAGAEAWAEVEYVLRRSSLEAGRPGWHAGDWDFHKTLYQPAARSRQLAMVDDLRRICVLHAQGYDTLAASTGKWLEDHEAIAEAYVKGQQVKACERLASHLRSAGERLFASFGTA